MNHQTKTDPDIESLFLTGGGRIIKGMERFGLSDGTRPRLDRLAILSVAVTWLPLLVLATMEGVALGDRVEVPLLKDFLPYGQFLIAIPILILGEAIVGKTLGMVVAELRRSDILSPEDTPKLDQLLTRVVERWRGRAVNIVFLILTTIITCFSLFGAQEWLTGAWQYIGDRITLPGWWYLLISVSVMRFLALRWLWRLLLWTTVLWRTAHLRLQPQPTHPDRAGGLAFLGQTQAVFGVLVFALSVQLSCLIADAVCYRGANLMDFKGHVIAYVLIVLIVLLLPLLLFAPKLIRVRDEKLLLLTGSTYNGAQDLERKLRENRTGELPTEISALCDMGALYENARWMKPVPLEWRHILVLLLAAILPFLPLVFLVMPAKEVFGMLLKLLG
ncbi:hypothetical protein L0156_10035 [bacterium]|nr:hypothetical protein [bacterium]